MILHVQVNLPFQADLRMAKGQKAKANPFKFKDGTRLHVLPASCLRSKIPALSWLSLNSLQLALQS